jgi:hypothetical protein
LLAKRSANRDRHQPVPGRPLGAPELTLAALRKPPQAASE